MEHSESTSDVAELHRRCTKLEDEVGRLKEAIQYLVYSKVTEPSFAFYSWLVKHDVFDRRRARLEHVLGVLESRLMNRTVTVKKSLPGIADEELYSSEPPNSESARRLLMQALDIANPTIIDELLHALGTHMPEREFVVWWERISRADVS